MGETPSEWSMPRWDEMTSRVTIQDIARIAGVSKSTVSRVLRGRVPVNADKAKAVRDATARLGFQPNPVAQSLASGRSLTIGVLTQKMGSPFYDAIAQGVIAGLAESEYSPIFADGQWESSREQNAILALVGRRVDGLVLIGGSLSSEEIAELSGGLPTVIVARMFPEGPHCSISVDNIGGAFLATQHLLENGHQRIAIIRGIASHVDSIDRYAGYKNALLAAGLIPDRRLVVDGDFSAESGIAGVEKLLAQQHEFTAIFAANDLTAFGARLALQRHGKRVPEDVSIVGFDDQLEAAYMTPPLTTVRQPAREMGQQAAQGILKLLSDGHFSSVVMHGEMIIRESVAPPPTP